MFAKPHWFQPTTKRWALRPASWQGWAYASIWVGVVVLPFMLLIGSGRVVESLIWAVASLGGLAWDLNDVRRTRRAQAEVEDLLYIGEDGRDQASTTRYDLQVKR